MNTVFTEFNNTLDEFVNKLINQFPDESKLKSYYNTFKIAKMYDSSVPIKIFMGGCLNFETQIKTRDSDFFVHRKQFVNKLKNCTSFSDDIGLVKYWEDLTDKSKTSIWDYVQTLYVIGEMYINKDTSVIDKINNIYNNLSPDEFENINDNNQLSESLISKIK